jgi:hypothetical protein
MLPLLGFSIINADILQNSIADTGNMPTEISLLCEGQTVVSVTKDKLVKSTAVVYSAKPSSSIGLVDINVVGSKRIQATKNQKFFDPVQKQWIKAHMLWPGNSLLGDDLKAHLIFDVNTNHSASVKTIQVVLDGNHYLFADGFLVHNHTPWKTAAIDRLKKIGKTITTKTKTLLTQISG